MTDKERKDIIKAAVKIMIQFQLEHRFLKLDCITDEFVEKWFEEKISNNIEIKNIHSM